MRFAAFLVAAGFCARLAMAAPGYLTEYEFTIDTGGNPVTNCMIMERAPGLGHNIFPFVFDSGTSSVQLSWAGSIVPTQSLIIGIVNGLPADGAAPVDHIVLFMDDTTASATQGVPWDSVFPNTPESALIADLQLATSGQDLATILPGFYGVNDWSEGDAVTANAWFATGGTFTVQTWSDGLSIGSGTSSITAVPEPAFLGFVCLSGCALLVRRRK
jgi:hypothetical protein